MYAVIYEDYRLNKVSDIKMEQKQIIKKHINKNIILTIVCIIFAAVYEHFSYQVYSAFMIGAFIFPLIFGVGANLIRLVVYSKRRISENILAVWQCSIYTLTVGSIYRGILDIYGTTNEKGALFWYTGAILAVFAVSIELYKLKAFKEKLR